MADEIGREHGSPRHRARLRRRQEEINAYRQIEKSQAQSTTYGFLYWHPVIGRLTAMAIIGMSLALIIAAAKNGAPYIEYTDMTQRGLFTLFAIFAIMGLITPPPRAALGFGLGFVTSGAISYCLWLGVSVWQFIETGGLANNQVLTAATVISLPFMILFGYLCKTFSREPLIPYGEQWFFFSSGNFTESGYQPLLNRRSGTFLGAFVVTVLGLVLAALQTAWTVFDLPKLSF